MTLPPDLARSLIGALDEPALLIAGSRTVAANPAALALLGQSIAGTDIRLAIRHPEALAAIQSDGDVELELVGIAGADRPWLVTVRQFGEGLRLVRLADRSLFRAAERMRVDFVANASHELRTPLATIAGYAETLADEGDVDEDTRRSFGSIIQSEAKRMVGIVEDLMSLSRIEADRFQAPTEAVDLAEIARVAVDQARPSCAGQSCTIDLAIEDGVPSVAGDYAQLLQVADNLISNAIRYGCTRPGGRITVEVRQDADEMLFAVRDTGEGIPAEHLPRLTERFYRVDAARSRDGGGTGLGLAIVKHIVERHRGTLDIRSTPGSGTSVEVRLPLS